MTKNNKSLQKRYFETAHNFASSYKNLGEQYILSSIVHLDEETPHMHLVFIPVVHTRDKNKYLYNNMKNLTEAVQYAEKLEDTNKELYKENKVLRREFRKLKNENLSPAGLVQSLQEK